MSRPYYYLGGNRALTQLSTGHPFFVNTDDRGIATWIILGGIWETFVDDVLSRLAKPGMNFLDVGANMGYYSVKIGGLTGPSGRIFSFEPNPELYPFLSDNICINDFGRRAQLFQLAVGNGEGSTDLKFDYQNMGGGSLAGGTERCRSVTVALDTLDRCIPEGTRIDLAKIDAEGYEPRILAGAKRLLKDNPDMAIVLEVSIPQWRTFGDPSQILGSLIGSEREIFRIDIGGAVRPMGSGTEFLRSIDDRFVSYCLLSPRTSCVRQALADLICEPAGEEDSGQPVDCVPAANADCEQPVIAPHANATVRQRARDLIVKYVPQGEELLRLRRSLMRRSGARSARASNDAAMQ